MQGPAPIPVFRPSKLTPGPEFQGSLLESPANIFYQQIKASRATLDRIQFQWRSVSDNLLISPIVRVRFKLKVGCPKLWTHLTSTIPLAGLARIQDEAHLLSSPLELISMQHPSLGAPHVSCLPTGTRSPTAAPASTCSSTVRAFRLTGPTGSGATTCARNSVPRTPRASTNAP